MIFVRGRHIDEIYAIKQISLILKLRVNEISPFLKKKVVHGLTILSKTPIKFDFVLIGRLVVLRINVDLAIFQPYLDLEAGDNQSLKIQVVRPGIEPRSSCSLKLDLYDKNNLQIN